MEDILLHTDEFILKAKEHIDCWEYIQARRLLMELLEEEPDNGRAHQLMGKIYAAELNQYDEAKLHLQMAIQFEPQNASAYSDYIYLLKMMRRHDEMIQFATKAERVDGVNLAYILYYKAEAYEALQQFKCATETYRKALMSAVETSMMERCEQGMARIEKKMMYQEQLSYLSGTQIA